MITPVALGAVLLAGGRASRVDGAVKPLFDVHGTTLLAAAVDAARAAGAEGVAVVGPVLDDTLDVVWIEEDPPHGGPAAAIVTALAALPADRDPEWMLVLACDLPAVRPAVARLVADLPLLPRDADGVCLGDASSRPQWLIGLYRTRALRRAASVLPRAGRDAAVRDLVADLAITVITADPALTHDVDTWEDLEQARARSTEDAP